jgi:hypothetical protein
MGTCTTPCGKPLAYLPKRKDRQTCLINCSATRFMRNYTSFFALIPLLVAGCARQKEQAPVPVQPAVVGGRTVQTIVVPAVVTNQLITKFGEHLVGDIWTVRVPEEERTVEIGAYGGFDKPSVWRAQAGWFVYVENERRAWAYDGDRDLLLFEAIKNPEGGPSGRTGILSGPTKFPCPVPEAVLTRLSEGARKAIAR